MFLCTIIPYIHACLCFYTLYIHYCMFSMTKTTGAEWWSSSGNWDWILLLTHIKSHQNNPTFIMNYSLCTRSFKMSLTLNGANLRKFKFQTWSSNSFNGFLRLNSVHMNSYKHFWSFKISPAQNETCLQKNWISNLSFEFFQWHSIVFSITPSMFLDFKSMNNCSFNSNNRLMITPLVK